MALEKITQSAERGHFTQMNKWYVGRRHCRHKGMLLFLQKSAIQKKLVLYLHFAHIILKMQTISLKCSFLFVLGQQPQHWHQH